MAAKRKATEDEARASLARSPIKAAALSVLLERPGHGYDVAQRINMRLGPSWQLEAKCSSS